jgi:ribosome recycling factor
MAYNFNVFNTKIKETQDWLIKELNSVRTGRSSVSFLDPVKVEAYGSVSPLSSVATVMIEDSKTIRVSPWDGSLLSVIDKAITIANLGVSVVNDGKGLRVIFPELTGERREQLIKVAKQKLEEAKVALRRERGEVVDDNELSEDDIVRVKAEMEKLVKEGEKKLEELFVKKEQEIRQ